MDFTEFFKTWHRSFFFFLLLFFLLQAFLPCNTVGVPSSWPGLHFGVMRGNK